MLESPLSKHLSYLSIDASSDREAQRSLTRPQSNHGSKRQASFHCTDEGESRFEAVSFSLRNVYTLPFFASGHGFLTHMFDTLPVQAYYRCVCVCIYMYCRVHNGNLWPSPSHTHFQHNTPQPGHVPLLGAAGGAHVRHRAPRAARDLQRRINNRHQRAAAKPLPAGPAEPHTDAGGLHQRARSRRRPDVRPFAAVSRALERRGATGALSPLSRALCPSPEKYITISPVNCGLDRWIPKPAHSDTHTCLNRYPARGMWWRGRSMTRGCRRMTGCTSSLHLLTSCDEMLACACRR